MIGNFSYSLMQSDPKLAVQWAGSISDANQRKGQMQSLASSWLRRDPDNARTWIAQSDLPADVKQRLLATKNR